MEELQKLLSEFMNLRNKASEVGYIGDTSAQLHFRAQSLIDIIKTNNLVFDINDFNCDDSNLKYELRTTLDNGITLFALLTESEYQALMGLDRE